MRCDVAALTISLSRSLAVLSAPRGPCRYATYATMAGVDPADKIGEAAGVPPIDGFDVLPLVLGLNATSPRTEIFFGVECLVQGDLKLLTGGSTSASWPGPTYPNSTSDGNTLNLYTANCSVDTPCLCVKVTHCPV
jgi:hypothetical protein